VPDAGILPAASRTRAAIAGLALALAACRPPEGPQPIVYDREPCAHCRMLISEPRFAAQLQTEAGEVESFDDPGCLLAALQARETPPRALWFHHVRDERWIDGAHVAFEPSDKTPMGYGLGAVDAGTAGALGLEEARLRVATRGARPEDRR
jgi:copper chaperone NosL